MKTFSEELREAREAKGLTLEELSEKTKIRLNILKAIETGDFELLPQTYIKGFIRSYAQIVGLDPALVVRDYEHHLKTTAAVFSEPKSIEVKGSRKIPWTIIGSVLGLFVVLVVFLLIGGEREKKSPQRLVRHTEETMSAQSSDTVSSTDAETFASDSGGIEAIEETLPLEGTGAEGTARDDGQPETPGAVDQDGLTLKALAVSDTWVQVKADGDGIYEGIMKIGASATWRADSLFELKIGKANGIRLELNGDPLGELGSAEKVVSSLTLNKSGIVEKILR